jgi:hypothetical protein
MTETSLWRMATFELWSCIMRKLTRASGKSRHPLSFRYNLTIFYYK